MHSRKYSPLTLARSSPSALAWKLVMWSVPWYCGRLQMPRFAARAFYWAATNGVRSVLSGGMT